MREAVKVFRALSDPTRLRILLLLTKRALCVCELMFILRMEQSRISHQLRILKDAGLLEDIRQGKWIIYRIPQGCRRRVDVLVGELLGDQAAQEGERVRDVGRLELCLKKGVRKRHASGLPPSRRTA